MRMYAHGPTGGTLYSHLLRRRPAFARFRAVVKPLLLRKRGRWLSAGRIGLQAGVEMKLCTDTSIRSKTLHALLVVMGLFLFLAPLAWPDGSARTFSDFSREDLRMLGVVLLPADAAVQESHQKIKLLATPGSRYSQKHIALLKYFIGRTPSVLLDAGPAAIITYKRGEVRMPLGSSPLSLAMASGPYIFFNTGAFVTGGIFSAGSLEGVFRAFVHELVHVFQFRKAVSQIDFARARDRFRSRKRQVRWDREALKTPLLQSFAKITGWEISGKQHKYARLRQRKTEKTSSYGKASILEDMAETVSLVVVGDLAPLSTARIKWAVTLLGLPSVEAALQDTFPYCELYKQVNLMGTGVTQFDKSRKEAYEKKYKIVDLEHFVDERVGRFEKIVAFMDKAFLERGWQRTFSAQRRLRHGVKKHVMEYGGRWRDVYVEIITYDDASDYALKPDGTIITVLSGYRL